MWLSSYAEQEINTKCEQSENYAPELLYRTINIQIKSWEKHLRPAFDGEVKQQMV